MERMSAPASHPPVIAADALAAALRDLYRRQLERFPDEYMAQHASPVFVAGSTTVNRFYEPWLPAEGRILDWGCRHAPDACLLRARWGDRFTLDGCDVHEGTPYPVFFAAAGLRYTRLTGSVLLPYEDRAFDAVIASGVLEHVPMDYESLKELHRVLKPGGRLMVSYLPNRWSIEEARLRWRKPVEAHQRLYSRRQLDEMLRHSGFLPRVLGYQTRFDALAADGAARWMRPLVRAAQLHRLTSCLCAVAERTDYF
jgi:SAM-dependent methyltransferase